MNTYFEVSGIIDVNPRTESVFLSIPVVEANPIDVYGALNIYTYGSANSLSSSVGLWLYNNGVQDSVLLYMSGYGTTDGMVYSQDSLNLYLQTANGSEISLSGSLVGCQNISGIMPASMKGVINMPSGDINAYIFSYDVKNDTIPLFIRGFR